MDPLQLLFSPVFGFLANKFRSIRAITLAACITYVGGNIIYSTLSLFPYDARYWMLLVCRFMVGISTGRLCVLQDDPSGFSLGVVDIKTKVVFTHHVGTNLPLT